MGKHSIQSLIKSKQEYTKEFIYYISKYLYKYFINLFEDLDDNLYDFQKKLYDIPSWSNKTIDKEYNYFLKVLKRKFDITEESIKTILDKIIALEIQILSRSQIEIQLPSLKKIWYKILKYTAKYFYEQAQSKLLRNYKELESDYYKQIALIIKNTLTKYIPIKDIFKSEPVEKVKYDFNDLQEFEDDASHKDNDIEPVIVQKEFESENNNSSESLKYISSEHFENEYYYPDDKKEENEDDVKQIAMPKFIGQKKKNIKNEIEERFFD
jgi:hypothetical protein